MDRPVEAPILAALRAADDEPLFDQVHRAARAYAAGVDARPVAPSDEAVQRLAAFDVPLPDGPTAPREILAQLHQLGSPATVAQTGGRYFGFVCGGALPVAVAARWLTDTWDQNPAMYVMSPVAAELEQVAERWTVALLGLPAETVAGFVSGCSTATMMGLATGRRVLFDRLGHDLVTHGMGGAPRLRVVVGDDAHATVFKGLGLLGFGTAQIERVPCDPLGRLRVDRLPALDDHTLVVLQAGHVHTGAYDDFATIGARARAAGAYVHIDGAFGLWAAASPRLRSLTEGIALADSWSVDGHKTLNTPYDNGICLSRHREALVATLHLRGSYLIESARRDSMHFTPEMSRRARGVDVWATLRALGRRGVAELVEELHDKARYLAFLLRDGGLDVPHEVVFNQVLVRAATDEKTEQLVAAVQRSGVCWLGGSRHGGRAVMRVSVSSYRTTMRDIERSATDILRCAASLR